LDLALSQEPDFIVATLPDCKRKPIHHIKRLIVEYPLIILIHQDPDLLALSVLRTDKDIGLFPVNIEFALDLLVDLGRDMKRVNTQGLDCVGFNVLVVHTVGVACGVLLLTDGLVHVRLLCGLVGLLCVHEGEEQCKCGQEKYLNTGILHCLLC
jgi:hypothetical protein